MSNRILLASASIGRRLLFEQTLREFIIEIPHVNEEQFSHEDPRLLPQILAEAKAHEVAKRYPDDYVLAFDTLVLCEGKLVGKPKNQEEAKNFLRFLSGKRQSVISGYAFIHQKKNIFESGKEETVLSFAELSEEFISTYVQTHPVTKFAGGYAIQNDDQFIHIEEGSFDVIVGAPMARVIEFLKREGLEHLLLPPPYRYHL
ncbi:Maf family protein [Thermospira aquatica]|uniref:Nucleoside triphosphate pyrophosphatase n=1 Tax=Thermospira aquatica TaxID=2828656 RepID=A0AAX3BG26_9SPIR|nr:Maf family nucleotide pyrophosphatase [Thermospira aquatica]URA11133.1 septum formation protein Maf [Thermospira aquatica]